MMDLVKEIILFIWHVINLPIQLGQYTITIFNVICFSTVIALFVKMIFGDKEGGSNG